MCVQEEGKTTLGLSPDLAREEKVSFQGKLKNPLLFRDAMLMLRQIVLSDMGQKKKDREDYFAWLTDEIEKRVLKHQKYLPDVRNELENQIDKTMEELDGSEKELQQLYQMQAKINRELKKYDSWEDYYKIERNFWQFIRERDYNLWYVLDPVITVHKDQVSFEAFSIDESTYGCFSVPMEEFLLLKEPTLGTTNIDFSARLAKEMERFRTYTDVTLSVNPDGFTTETGVVPPHIEKKIDLPETWIKGFNQVSAAAGLGGIDLFLSPIDMYDICSFLKRYKEKQSPRYMKWILTPKKPIQILFEPFGKILTLKAVYQGERKREEKIWGRRRWLVLEKLIPNAKSFQIRFLGFGLPQFIIADLGSMKMTIGFSSWSSNDWVKGTAFQVMAGFVGEGNYKDVFSFLKQERSQSFNKIYEKFAETKPDIVKSGVGMLFRRGEGYFDLIHNAVRFRMLCNTKIPDELYETTEIELAVQEHLKQGVEGLLLHVNEKREYVFKKEFQLFQIRKQDKTNTELFIDEDGQITKVACNCRAFLKGPKNISAPCSHILALYLLSNKFIKLDLEQNKEYTINDIMEMLL